MQYIVLGTLLGLYDLNTWLIFAEVIYKKNKNIMTWNYITKVIDSNYTIQQVCDENLFILPDIMCQMFFLENTYSVCMGQVYA